jgi:hypothetical protein
MEQSVGRNLLIEKAVERAVARVDAFIDEEKMLALPGAVARAAADAQLSHKSNSVRLASLFFVFYAIEDRSWDRNQIPTGLRGQFGDKRLATELGLRSITLHNAITAFGENLGWKGNVKAIKLQDDRTKFAAFSRALQRMTKTELTRTADYMAARFAESRQLVTPLPPVGEDILTFARARQLFYTLVESSSEGNIQQFLIAALLYVHRTRYGYEIRTHHVHASDKSDGTAGDIEEFVNGKLHRAFEVTVRPDWKNRMGDFRAKMDAAGLLKYTIIASDVRTDDELAEPASMMKFLEPYGRDIAVVDIHDLLNVFAMELTAEELRQAINRTYSYIVTPQLCGRTDVMKTFTTIVSKWLDMVAAL